jgi:hypothetical protein
MPYFCYLVIWLADQLVGWLVGWLVILNGEPLNNNSVFNSIFNFTGYRSTGPRPPPPEPKQPVREVNRTFISSAEVKMTGGISLLHTNAFMVTEKPISIH